ncbi:hypothetical protein Pcinc_001833 [Petrolisthes cinctipes]|uniref:Uncharacterized protein n=1 Tax=Petrolisthes cinctipes TaxID=88211 RepID=A0AAE1GKT7_PETCI|nr:hypothetical protein Pcinc_001833 [Petrolisthes cinctipes]
MSQVPLTEAGHTCCCCCSPPGHSRTHSLSRASLSKCQLGLMVPGEASRGDDVFGFHVCWSGVGQDGTALALALSAWPPRRYEHSYSGKHNKAS